MEEWPEAAGFDEAVGRSRAKVLDQCSEVPLALGAVVDRYAASLQRLNITHPSGLHQELTVCMPLRPPDTVEPLSTGRTRALTTATTLADVNPRRIKVAVPRRARPTLPPFIELTQVTGEAHTVFYEGLAAQPVADAILECRGRIETARLLEAAQRARTEGLPTTSEWRRVQKGL